MNLRDEMNLAEWAWMKCDASASTVARSRKSMAQLVRRCGFAGPAHVRRVVERYATRIDGAWHRF